MRKKLTGFILSVILLLSLNEALAQSYAESALLFSRVRPGGSARIQAIGGAQVSLGGDYSSALSNPAGLGMYNRSEFSFSPALTTYSSAASYRGSKNTEITSKFNVPGLSLVFNFPKEDRSFLGGSLGISFTRINDFNNSTFYSGDGNSSIIDYFIEDSDGYPLSQFDEGAYQYNRPTGLAFDAYVIDAEDPFDSQNPLYKSVVERDLTNQTEEIKTSGASNQWSISYGANFNDKFFIGGGLGINSIKYKSRKNYTESYTRNNNFNLNDLILNEELNITGSGINVTIGLIARPIDHLQIGFSFASPTFYQLSETYNANLEANWPTNYDYYGDGSVILNNEYFETDIVTSDYNLTTPLKVSTGITYISKIGFITADVEFTNPGKARYNSEYDSYSNENDEIRNIYKGAVNLRLGGEFRYEMFRFRAGYSSQGNTFKSGNQDNAINSISAGFGIKTKKFFADLAWVKSKSGLNYSPYSFIFTPEDNPVVAIKNKVTNVMITVGFTF